MSALHSSGDRCRFPLAANHQTIPALHNHTQSNWHGGVPTMGVGWHASLSQTHCSVCSIYSIGPQPTAAPLASYMHERRVHQRRLFTFADLYPEGHYIAPFASDGTTGLTVLGAMLHQLRVAHAEHSMTHIWATTSVARSRTHANYAFPSKLITRLYNIMQDTEHIRTPKCAYTMGTSHRFSLLMNSGNCAARKWLCSPLIADCDSFILNSWGHIIKNCVKTIAALATGNRR